MAECRIARCSCVSEQQDKLYGASMRLWNPMGKDGDKYRCTVCGATSGGTAVKKK